MSKKIRPNFYCTYNNLSVYIQLTSFKTFFQIPGIQLIFCILYFSSRAFRPTRGIVIQKFVCASVRPCVRPCVRMMSQTCTRQNLRTVIGMDLLFFLMGWYKSGVVQWQTKLGLRMGKALRKIDFFRFFYKKIHNFPTKIDIDLIFFL